MNILYTAFVRLPTEKAHGVQIVKTCEALAALGERVTLAIPGRKTITKDPFLFYGARNNFKIKEYKVPDFVSFGFFGFVISALLFSERVRLSKVFSDADVVYSRDAFVLLQYLLLGKKLIYEAHTKPTFISTFVARRCQKIVVISKGLADEYRLQGVRNVLVAPDAVDIEAFKTIFNKDDVRDRFLLPKDRKIALYVGKIDEAKGADVFARSSEYTKALCVLIGSGNKKFKLLYPNAVFLDETPYKDLPQVLSLADVLVIPNSADDIDSSTYTSPLKAYAYMAKNLPIVSSDVSALREVFADQDVTFFTSGDARACAASIDKALLKGKVTYRVYTWKDRAKDIVSFI